ncbi:MAG: 5-oxoprolinase subunit PxpB [Lewinellaceae bacterium]|nr:5-oxoprolinase subunit PxpB [Lewinellaceae bacterium]
MHILPLAEHALLVHWDNRIDPLLNDAVQALYRTLSAADLPGLRDLLPAYGSLTIVLDLDYFDRRHPAADPLLVARNWVETAIKTPVPDAMAAGRTVEIPVCYDSAFAPDLEALAARAGLTAAEVVALHTDRVYRVYLIGFLPGFAYMGAVDTRLAAPRLARPRGRVPTGSVGIAGAQTGIYPLESPGGWNLIGRTPLRLFDPQRPEPVLLQPGDQVRFRAISTEAFHQIEQTR